MSDNDETGRRADGTDYEVGYGRPPKHTQFQRGRSGNPSGRPKGSQSMPRILEEVVGERIAIQKNGRIKKVTQKKALLMKELQLALQGDKTARKTMIDLICRYDPELTKSLEAQEPSPDDQAILMRALGRLQRELDT